MVGPIDVKRKGSASVGYWVQYVTLTFDLTHDLDLGCFKVTFRNSSISGIVGLIDVKWKRSELIWYWADCMTLPFDHTHDLDPGVEISKLESEIALSQEWEGQLTWNEKDVSHPFMTMILTNVTMGGGQMYRIVTGATYLVVADLLTPLHHCYWPLSIIVIRTLHDCPSQMNEYLLISNSKLTSDSELIWWR